jgi:hypothetical protein
MVELSTRRFGGTWLRDSSFVRHSGEEKYGTDRAAISRSIGEEFRSGLIEDHGGVGSCGSVAHFESMRIFSARSGTVVTFWYGDEGPRKLYARGVMFCQATGMGMRLY